MLEKRFNDNCRWVILLTTEVVQRKVGRGGAEGGMEDRGVIYCIHRGGVGAACGRDQSSPVARSDRGTRYSSEREDETFDKGLKWVRIWRIGAPAALPAEAAARDVKSDGQFCTHGVHLPFPTLLLFCFLT